MVGTKEKIERRKSKIILRSFVGKVKYFEKVKYFQNILRKFRSLSLQKSKKSKDFSVVASALKEGTGYVLCGDFCHALSLSGHAEYEGSVQGR